MDDYGNQMPIDAVDERLARGDARMGSIEEEIKTARQELHDLKEQLAELLEFFNAMKGAFKVLNWLGRLSKPFAYIVGACTAALGFWAALKGIKQ